MAGIIIKYGKEIHRMVKEKQMENNNCNFYPNLYLLVYSGNVLA
jgi:hypothetical protein